MELKIKDDSKKPKMDNGMPDLGLGDMDENMSGMGNFGGYSENPIKISTNIDYDTPKTKSSSFDVMPIVKIVVIIAVIAIVAKLIAGLINPEVVDVTDYINSDADAVAKALDIEMKPDAEMATQIHHYSNGTVTVEGNGEVGVVYMDGAYAGLHIDAKGYSMFGVAIGDPEYDAVEALNFDYDDSMVVLNDLAAGSSSTVYYYNVQKNNCVALITNGNTNRVVAITYFSNYSKIIETLESIE